MPEKPTAALLIPRPHDVRGGDQRYAIGREPVIAVAADAASGKRSADHLLRALGGLGLRPLTRVGADTRSHAAADISLRPADAHELPAQGYRLDITGDGVSLLGADAAGLFYGACTLIQWLRLHARDSADGAPILPELHVVDWPDFTHRGVMLDVSRDKVPTMATLTDLIDLLAGWKINQLQLYMEHTFAYRGHERVWRHASPFSAQQIRALDDYCRARFIELVPNQNSLGHFHRWLAHEPYRALAECPDGIAHPFSERPEPFSLCPVDPGSLQLLEGLYDQLLPLFSSRLFNVGLDETFDLGLGRSAKACAARGKQQVYLTFVRQLHERVRARHHRMQMWGDIVIERPDLIGELPEDIIMLEWGYEADHPFDTHLQQLAASGLDFYVCPGTSSWNSLLGRTDNALRNLAAAARSGVEHRALGYLITDWGDWGHLQPLCASYIGLLAGAGWAWHAPESDGDGASLDIARLLDRHVFADTAEVVGSVVRDLGNAYRECGGTAKNGSALFYLLVFPDRPLDHACFRGLDEARLRGTRDYIERAAARLDRQRMQRPDAALIVRELRWAASLLALACRLGCARLEHRNRAAITRSLPINVRRDLLAALDPLIAQHHPLWLARARAGGRRDSVRHLQRLRTALSA